MIRDGLDRESRADQYALILQDFWRKEIERAINEVKNSGKRTRLDQWFRRRWYIAQAVRRKREKSESEYGVLQGRGRTNDRLVRPGGIQNGRSQ